MFLVVKRTHVFGRPGSDLLSQALRLSTIGAKRFNGRVRDGIGFWASRNGHQIGEKHLSEFWFVLDHESSCSKCLSRSHFVEPVFTDID